jgi:valyl-tRNA synthetase
MVAPYPEGEGVRETEAEAQMERFMALVTEIRTIRSTYEVEPRRRIDATVVAASGADRDFVLAFAPLVRALARVERLEVVSRAAEAERTIRHPVGPFELRIPMAGLFDIAAEKTRLAKERLKVDGELEGLRKRLDNPRFVERARPEVVAESRQRVSELEARRARIEATLRELGP